MHTRVARSTRTRNLGSIDALDDKTTGTYDKGTQPTRVGNQSYVFVIEMRVAVKSDDGGATVPSWHGPRPNPDANASEGIPLVQAAQTTPVFVGSQALGSCKTAMLSRWFSRAFRPRSRLR